MFIKRAILLFISLALSISIAEIILGKYFPQKTYSSFYKNAISCFTKSETTVFTLKPNCTIPFVDFDTNESIITKTDSLGYRGSDFPIDKPKDETRILLSGDSFILGFGVKDNEVVSDKLAEQLKNISRFNPLYRAKVINAGYAGGFGPDGYYLHLKNEGMKLAPDLVIFSIFVYNDLSDIENSEWIGIGPFGEPTKVISTTTTVDEEGRLIPASIPLVYRLPLIRDSHVAILIQTAFQKIGAFTKHYYDRLRFTIKSPTFSTGEARDSNFLGSYTSFCIFVGSCHRRTIHLFSDLLSVMKAGSQLVNDQYKDGRPHFLVMLIPSDFQLYEDALKKYNDSGIPYTAVSEVNPNPQRRIKEMLDKEKIPYIDLLPVFRESNKRLYFKTDGHWNKMGHEAAAEYIKKWIEENYR